MNTLVENQKVLQFPVIGNKFEPDLYCSTWLKIIFISQYKLMTAFSSRTILLSLSMENLQFLYEYSFHLSKI